MISRHELCNDQEEWGFCESYKEYFGGETRLVKKINKLWNKIFNKMLLTVLTVWDKDGREAGKNMKDLDRI